MTDKNKGWAYSFDNENFSSGMFSTKKEALSDAQREGLARNEQNDENNQFIYIAKSEHATNEQFFPDADIITEHMFCNAEDVGGDYADKYPDVSVEAEEELTDALHKLLSDWCNKHEVAPSFYTVSESKKYNISTLKPVN